MHVVTPETLVNVRRTVLICKDGAVLCTAGKSLYSDAKSILCQTCERHFWECVSSYHSLCGVQMYVAYRCVHGMLV